MLDEICAEIKNYFTFEKDIHIGDFSIVNGSITPALEIPTNYIRIVGSHMNDGIHLVSDHDLVDESTFHGAIWIMSPPIAFLSLAEEIASWQAQNGSVDSVAMSPFTSESFGGYSYTKASGSSANGVSGAGVDWKSAYAKRLNVYRRIRLV